MDVLKILSANPRSRPKPFTFRPPKENRLVRSICLSMVLPARIRSQLKVTDIEVEGDGLARLRALQGSRCLLMPSHSGGHEPLIVMQLSRQLGMDFNYLAAMEAFETSWLTGWAMQRMGAYSIIRGTADRASFQMTRRILAEGKRWLVIFPEGQTVWQNDTVIPFQEGVTQLAFKAYEDAVKREEEASLHCVPIAIKYQYLKDMTPEIDASLTRLEDRALAGLGHERGDIPERIRRVSEAVLTANEKKHGVTPSEGADFNARMQAMKEFVVSRIEIQLGVEPLPNEALLDRVRRAFNSVDRIVQEDGATTAYESMLIRERQATANRLYDDLWRVLQFIAIYADYLRERMTVERIMDVLCLLEMEVLGERRMWGPRKACIRVGEPEDLKSHAAEYRADKRGTVSRVTLSLEDSVRDMLADMSSKEVLAGYAGDPA